MLQNTLENLYVGKVNVGMLDKTESVGTGCLQH